MLFGRPGELCRGLMLIVDLASAVFVSWATFFWDQARQTCWRGKAEHFDGPGTGSGARNETR